MGNKSGDGMIRLDDYKDVYFTYLKADIEGDEVSMLDGAEELMKSSIKQVLVCTYHKPNDQARVVRKLREKGMNCYINPGFVLYDVCNSSKPYVRHAVVYGSRAIDEPKKRY